MVAPADIDNVSSQLLQPLYQFLATTPDHASVISFVKCQDVLNATLLKQVCEVKAIGFSFLSGIRCDSTAPSPISDALYARMISRSGSNAPIPVRKGAGLSTFGMINPACCFTATVCHVSVAEREEQGSSINLATT